jgi:hypothetical protein
VKGTALVIIFFYKLFSGHKKEMELDLDLTINNTEQQQEKEYRVLPVALYTEKLSKKEFIRAIEDNDLNLHFTKEDID